jgi:putative membrane protein
MQSIAMALTALLIPKLRITGIFGALGTVVCLGLINATVWDAALFFNVPNSFTSQAVMLFLANGILFWVLVKILPGIEVDGVLPALIAPVVFTFCSLIVNEFGKDIDWAVVFDQVVKFVTGTRDALGGKGPETP